MITNGGSTDVCLCISGVPFFLESNEIASAAVHLVGKSQVTATIEELVSRPDPVRCDCLCAY
jgi:hypothetical protein